MAQDLKYPCNSRNPYDFFGAAHNYLVQTIINKHGAELVKARSDFRAEQELVVRLMGEIASPLFAKPDFAGLSSLPGTNGLYANADFTDISEIVLQTRITDSAKVRLTGYLRQLVEMPLETNEEVNSFIDTVREFENTYRSVDEQTDETVLSALAVAKFSAYLWQDIRNQGGPGGNDAMRIRWGCVGADIAGGLLAGLAGAAAGSTIVRHCFYD